MRNFRLCEVVKGDISSVVESVYGGVIPKTNPSIYAVGLVAKGAQHGMGFLTILGFVEDLVVDEDDGIGGDQHIFTNRSVVVHGFVIG